MNWIIILGIVFLLFSSCTKINTVTNDEVNNEEIICEEGCKLLKYCQPCQPNPDGVADNCGCDYVCECPEVNTTELEMCDGNTYPCLIRYEELNEYNYCEMNSNCVFANIPECECSAPNSPGLAINFNEQITYDTKKAEECLYVDVDCPQYAPPIYTFVHEPRCINNFCRAVRTGVRN